MEFDFVQLKEAIVEAGTAGVLRYRQISGSKHDNQFPEVFLGGFMATRLFDRFHFPVHVERLYAVLAWEAGIDPTPELLVDLGGLRADIALCPPSGPSIIVELKILDERKQPSSIADDLRKISKLAKSAKINGMVGAIVCETATQHLDARVSGLEEALRAKVLRGPAQQSGDGNWKWLFGCATLVA